MSDEAVTYGHLISPEMRDLARRLRRAMTPEERILWQELRANRLGVRFRRQQILHGFIADFYCHAAKLVVEIDGPIHQSRRDHDIARDYALATHGFRTLRVNNDDVRTNIDGVLTTIRRALQEPKPEQH